MDKLEMMVGYEINFYETKFSENYKKLSYYMKKCLNDTIGHQIRGIAIEEKLLYAWAYYFVTIADEDPKVGDKIMIALINHFKKLMSEEEKIKIHGDKNTRLMIDPSFCKVWFGTSLHVMLIRLYGDEDYLRVFDYIHHNYLESESKIRTLILD